VLEGMLSGFNWSENCQAGQMDEKQPISFAVGSIETAKVSEPHLNDRVDERPSASDELYYRYVTDIRYAARMVLGSRAAEACEDVCQSVWGMRSDTGCCSCTQAWAVPLVTQIWFVPQHVVPQAGVAGQQSHELYPVPALSQVIPPVAAVSSPQAQM
jgi:hypothetical protein